MISQRAKKGIFLWTLFQELRQRRFPLSPNDYHDLRRALELGFGWSSNEALCDLCCLLWAKSQREQQITAALFNQLAPAEWSLGQKDEGKRQTEVGPRTNGEAHSHPIVPTKPVPPPTVRPQGGLAAISIEGTQIINSPLILVPQLSLGYREIAQAWRRLRRPIRRGPQLEVDIEATIAARVRLGIPSPAVLIPRRRNTARALLLVDRQGSMSPFHYLVDELLLAIRQASRLESIEVLYFHDVPVEAKDKSVLGTLSRYHGLFPILDPVLAQIKPDLGGVVFKDHRLVDAISLEKAANRHASRASVIIISDAGAARRRYDVIRLINTIAFFKGLRRYTTSYVWLNPLPRARWADTTAEQIARHIPMFALDQQGLYTAVNVLRGQPFQVESSI